MNSSLVISLNVELTIRIVSFKLLYVTSNYSNFTFKYYIDELFSKQFTIAKLNYSHSISLRKSQRNTKKKVFSNKIRAQNKNGKTKSDKKCKTKNEKTMSDTRPIAITILKILTSLSKF